MRNEKTRLVAGARGLAGAWPRQCDAYAMLIQRTSKEDESYIMLACLLIQRISKEDRNCKAGQASTMWQRAPRPNKIRDKTKRKKEPNLTQYAPTYLIK